MECEKTFLFLDELKSYIYSDHDGLNALSHFKRQSMNQEFFDETFYFANDLFRIKKDKN